MPSFVALHLVVDIRHPVHHVRDGARSCPAWLRRLYRGANPICKQQAFHPSNRAQDIHRSSGTSY
jgi:hypothetical protein